MRNLPTVFFAGFLCLAISSQALGQSEAPRIISRLHPDKRINYKTPYVPYPSQAQLLHVSGKGVVQVSFDDQGNATKAVMVKSTGSPTLNDATVTYTRRHWKSDPGNPSTLEVHIDFERR